MISSLFLPSLKSEGGVLCVVACLPLMGPFAVLLSLVH